MLSEFIELQLCRGEFLLFFGNHLGRCFSDGLVGAMQVMVPLADLIDPVAELQRLDKEINRLQKSIVGAEKKLASPA